MEKNKKNTEQKARELLNDALEGAEEMVLRFVSHLQEFVIAAFHIKKVLEMSMANRILFVILLGFLLMVPNVPYIIAVIVGFLAVSEYRRKDEETNKEEPSNASDEEASKEESSDVKTEDEIKSFDEIKKGFLSFLDDIFDAFMNRTFLFIRNIFSTKYMKEKMHSSELVILGVLFAVVIHSIPEYFGLIASTIIIVSLWLAEYYEFEFSFIKKNEKIKIDSLNKEVNDLKQKIEKAGNIEEKDQKINTLNEKVTTLTAEKETLSTKFEALKNGAKDIVADTGKKAKRVDAFNNLMNNIDS